MTELFYPMPESPAYASSPGGRSHALDSVGVPVCRSEPPEVLQETLDREPTCGWCRLMIGTCCGRLMERRRTFDGLSFIPSGRPNRLWRHCRGDCGRWELV